MDLLRSLDLFAGIGGITRGIERWASPVAYCEQNRFCQAALLSRMWLNQLPRAPIWDDVRTLRGSFLPRVDLIAGGFPCQDISSAGRGAGLGGKRSSLFFEIVRLAEETRAPFIFLENVPAIRTRGLREVVGALTEVGYDCRWTCVTASRFGAWHKRERWFLLAYSYGFAMRDKSRRPSWTQGQDSPELGDDGEGREFADDTSARLSSRQQAGLCADDAKVKSGLVDESERRCFDADTARKRSNSRTCKGPPKGTSKDTFPEDWWVSEPEVGRVVYGPSLRLDQLRGVGGRVVRKRGTKSAEGWEKTMRPFQIQALGNGVVPQCVTYAFDLLLNGGR